jgi:uncharacterized membrane protein YedE/YeeE
MKVLAGAGVGIVFGITLSWSGMTSPDVLRGALLFERSYLFLMFASAVATAALAQALLRRRADRTAILTGEPLTYGRERPQRHHLLGSLAFGVGWGIADACPGPIATQIGQGIPWAIFTLTGVLLGVWLNLRQGATETEPASDAVSAEGADETRPLSPAGAR